MDGFTVDETALTHAAETFVGLQESLAAHGSLKFGVNPELLHDNLRKAVEGLQESLLHAVRLLCQDTGEAAIRLDLIATDYVKADQAASAALDALAADDET